MTLNLVKDQKIDLTKNHPGLTSVKVGLGWTENKGTGDEFDLDAFAFALRDAAPSLNDVLYFNSPSTNNPSNPDEKGALNGALIHSGDNLTGHGDGDDETIVIDFSKIPVEITQIIVGVSVYDAVGRGGQTFGRVSDSYIKVYNAATNAEIANYDLNEDYSSYNAVVAARFYRHNGEWKFQALGQGKNGDLKTLASDYQ